MARRLANAASRASNLWYQHKQPLKRLYQLPLIGTAYLYRQLLGCPVRIAVTGSLGKTQTKILIASVLAKAGTLRFDPGTDNRTYDVAKNLLLTSPRKDFCLQEIGMDGPGSMPAPVRLFHPDMGVITNIRSDHGDAFATRAQHVAEKATLIRNISSRGWAILNADEPDLETLRQETSAKILTYGVSERADVRAIAIIDKPPRPAALIVNTAGETMEIQTRLYGHHTAYAALAALAVARALAIPLQDAAAAIADAPPAPGRMEYVVHDDGVSFLLDDFKSSVDTLGTIRDFLRACDSVTGTKILVLGTIMYAKDPAESYGHFLREVRPHVDEIVLVGDLASSVDPEALPPDVRSFASVQSAVEYLNPKLTPGDLVVLKGRLSTDHLRRLEIVRRATVNCWQMDCGRIQFCDQCRFVDVELG